MIVKTASLAVVTLLMATATPAPISATPAIAQSVSVPGTPTSGAELHLDADRNGMAESTVQLVTRTEQLFVGDWDGDGIDTPGSRTGSTMRLYDEHGAQQAAFTYGSPGDRAVIGDWNGDGVDGIGVRRDTVFLLRDQLNAGAATVTFGFGSASDTPLVGDWDGNGRDDVGVHRASTFFLRTTLSAGPATSQFTYGSDTDLPLIGDWNGNGRDDVAVTRGSLVLFRMSATGGPAEQQRTFGRAEDARLAGDWDARGQDGLAAVRPCSACDVAAQVLRQVNAHRQNAGAPALRWNSGLGTLAQQWSEQMSAARTMSHNPGFCTTTFDAGFLRCGENVARTGSSSATGVMNAWMDSPGHRANILNPAYTSIGVGVAQGSDGRWYWTQNFGG